MTSRRSRTVSAADVARTLTYSDNADRSDSRRPSTESFYRSRDTARLPSNTTPHTWGPGQMLPISSAILEESQHHLPEYDGESSSISPQPFISDMMRIFQSSMEREFQKLSSKIDNVIERMDTLEKSHNSLEEQMQRYSDGSILSTPKTPVASKKRRRLTPIALQDKIRKVHSSFDEEKQIKITEPINSPHNSQVTATIIKAVGTEKYNEDGCKTYRKSLAEKSRHMTTPVKKRKCIRSMKQRSYERRAKVVKTGKESALWQDVTPDMMSDEEKRDDVFVRHTPTYRSSPLAKFISKLDSRCQRKMSSHPRNKRDIGSPRKAHAPPNAKKWTVKKSTNTAPEPIAKPSTSTTAPAESATTSLPNSDVEESVGEEGVTYDQSSEFDVSSSDDMNGVAD